MNEWIKLEERYGSGAYGRWPMALEYGKGTRVWDTDGKEYLDCASGIGVAALGHANPEIAQAISEQAGILLTCHGAYYGNDVRARFLKELTRITPDGLDHVFLCNSGTEAVETAIKLAKAHAKRSGIVAAMRGFHGRTLGSLSATWKRSFRRPFEPLVPGFTHIPFGDIDALIDKVTEETAAVLLEPVQGEAGIYPATNEYLQEARRLCDELGALLIFDEVQSGMGRTGTWFACEHTRVFPDILCLAKALGGGVPLGAAVFRRDLRFERGQHGSTFGGNPLSCRAGLAVIEYIEKHGLLTHATRVGAYFLDGLQKLTQEHPEAVREARGLGLMLALQLRRTVTPVLIKLMEAGVLALSAGRTNIRFLPPLILTRAEVDEVLAALEMTLS